MEDRKKISMAVIKRLPKYYRYLGELLDKDINRISSKELSKKMNATASQIRQDLNNFGCFGQQGYGYNVDNLYNEIKKILGLHHQYNMIVIGAGNIGRALVHYDNFKDSSFHFSRIFDSDENIIGASVNGIKIHHISTLEDFLKNNVVDIAILSIPKKETLCIAKIVADNNVKAIWNFSNEDLGTIKTIPVENVHLIDGLMTLTYRINDSK